jgi:hypothetical protein
MTTYCCCTCCTSEQQGVMHIVESIASRCLHYIEVHIYDWHHEYILVISSSSLLSSIHQILPNDSSDFAAHTNIVDQQTTYYSFSSFEHMAVWAFTDTHTVWAFTDTNRSCQQSDHRRCVLKRMVRRVPVSLFVSLFVLSMMGMLDRVVLCANISNVYGIKAGMIPSQSDSSQSDSSSDKTYDELTMGN